MRGAFSAVEVEDLTGSPPSPLGATSTPGRGPRRRLRARVPARVGDEAREEGPLAEVIDLSTTPRVAGAARARVSRTPPGQGDPGGAVSAEGSIQGAGAGRRRSVAPGERRQGRGADTDRAGLLVVSDAAGAPGPSAARSSGVVRPAPGGAAYPPALRRRRGPHPSSPPGDPSREGDGSGGGGRGEARVATARPFRHPPPPVRGAGGSAAARGEPSPSGRRGPTGRAAGPPADRDGLPAPPVGLVDAEGLDQQALREGLSERLHAILSDQSPGFQGSFAATAFATMRRIRQQLGLPSRPTARDGRDRGREGGHAGEGREGGRVREGREGGRVRDPLGADLGAGDDALTAVQDDEFGDIIQAGLQLVAANLLRRHGGDGDGEPGGPGARGAAEGTRQAASPFLSESEAESDSAWGSVWWPSSSDFSATDEEDDPEWHYPFPGARDDRWYWRGPPGWEPRTAFFDVPEPGEGGRWASAPEERPFGSAREPEASRRRGGAPAPGGAPSLAFQGPAAGGRPALHFGRITLPPPAGLPLPLHLLLSTRDFTDEDYEALLRLDEGVSRPRGATKAQIAELKPRRALAREAGRLDACSICIEEIAVGKMLRRLPCGHVFHSGCIARWLKEKASCPVCVRNPFQEGGREDAGSGPGDRGGGGAGAGVDRDRGGRGGADGAGAGGDAPPNVGPVGATPTGTSAGGPDGPGGADSAALAALVTGDPDCLRCWILVHLIGPAGPRAPGNARHTSLDRPALGRLAQLLPLATPRAAPRSPPPPPQSRSSRAPVVVGQTELPGTWLLPSSCPASTGA